jgi:hypothetical protein
MSAGSENSAASRRAGPQQRLVALIPPVTRESCKTAAQGVADQSATASVECGLAGIDAIYQLFPSDSVMNQWYALARETAGISPSSGSCTPAAFRGEAARGGGIRGRYLCVLVDGEPRLYETDERHAVSTELDYYAGKGRRAIASLLRQWRCCTELAP